MKNALDDINAAFLKATGTKVTVSYAASSALAKQLEQGAPADIFASADLEWMDYSAGKKAIKDGTRVNLLGNKLVLIAPKDSKIDNVALAANFDLATTYAPRWRWWRAAKPCSASCTRPTPRWRRT
jgi:molybdate transport system substrate-binding protein